MRPQTSVLAILGDPVRFDSVVDWIRRRGQSLTLVTTGADGIRAHRDHGGDLVLVGLPLEDAVAAAIVKSVRDQDPRVPIIVTGTDTTVGGAIDAFELGAVDYVADPVVGLADLVFSLGVALGVRAGDLQLRQLRDRDAVGAHLGAVLGASAPMRQVRAAMRAVCQRTAGGAAPTVLLTGETGTGKMLVAKVIHYNGARRNRMFLHVNCAALPEDQFEAVLFGQEKGAPLSGGASGGARSIRAGAFETADGGTLFLEEIGAVPIDLQQRLLIAIEDRQVRRVGGMAPFAIDVHLVASTHRDLGAMAKRGEFRSDLYHRLSVLAIALPPLRERGDDVVAIAESLIAQLAREIGRPPPRLADDARASLVRHAWPGNVRELHNELERIVLLSDDDVVRAAHFRFAGATADGLQVGIEATATSLTVALSGDRCPLESLEREVIRQALVRCRGNVSRTARFLAITRQTLIYRMKKFGFASPSNPGLDQDADEDM